MSIVGLRMGVLVLLSIAVLALRFFVFSQPHAQLFIVALGYWIMLVGAVLYGIYLARFIVEKWTPALWVRYRLGVLVAVLGACFLQLHEPRQFKVLYDEYTISGVARNMHFSREATYPSRAHYIDDRLQVLASGIDRRPIFFQFILSGVHDCFGYRPENVFVLNGVIAFFLLLITYYLGASYGGALLGITMAALWLGLPLLAQNATGGGYDTLNLLMLSVFAFFGREYLRSGSVLAQSLFVLTAVHLAQVRYESILYILPMVGVIVIKNWRDQSLKLGWIGATFPLGLLLPLLINMNFVQTPGAFQTNPGEAFFSGQHFPDNFLRAYRYLFDFSLAGSNSVLLSVLGFGAAGLLAVGMAHRWRKFVSTGDDVLFGGIFIVIVMNTLLVLCNFWGQWDDPVATRFSLPLHLLFVWSIGYGVSGCFANRRLPIWIPWSAVVVSLAFSTAASARNQQTRELLHGREFAWFFEQLSREEHRRALVIAHPVGPILHGYASVGVEVAENAKWKIAECLRLGVYPEILALERVCVDLSTGREISYGQAKGWEVKALGSGSGVTALSSAFKKQVVAEISWRPGIVSRLVRVVGVELDSSMIPVKASTPILKGKHHGTYIYSLLP